MCNKGYFTDAYCDDKFLSKYCDGNFDRDVPICNGNYDQSASTKRFTDCKL